MLRKYMLLIFSIAMTTGCNPQGQGQQTQSFQKASENMAFNQSIQQAFSDGRLKVIQANEKTKRSILQNTLKEQQVMMADPQLLSQLLGLNVKLNQMMTTDTAGKEQLMDSSLKVMEGINDDANKHYRLMKIQNESRMEAMKNQQLQNEILKQGIKEGYLTLENPATMQDAKELSLKTTEAIARDKKLNSKLLLQQIEGFRTISETPDLRSKMADAMLPLLKDPKIASELEKMIKMAVAKEMKKLQAMMQQQSQQVKKQQLSQEKMDRKPSEEQGAQ